MSKTTEGRGFASCVYAAACRKGYGYITDQMRVEAGVVLIGHAATRGGETRLLAGWDEAARRFVFVEVGK